MSRPRFLLDENVSPTIQRGVARRAPGNDIVRVGGDGAPAWGTPDPDLLAWCEENDRILVTFDKATMPGHLAEHLGAGRASPGVLIIRRAAALSTVIEALVLVLEASQADEWHDQVWYIPL